MIQFMILWVMTLDSGFMMVRVTHDSTRREILEMDLPFTIVDGEVFMMGFFMWVCS